MTFKVLGCNDDKDFCNCCNKQGLKRVVWLENTESGEVSHYGTSCASRLVGFESIKRAETKFKDDLIKLEQLLFDQACEMYAEVDDRNEFECKVGEFLLSTGRTFSNKTNANCYIRKIKR